MTAVIGVSSNGMNAPDILAGFVLDQPDDNTECDYRYTHRTTGRIFTVRRSERVDGKSRFFLCEMRPNGRMFEPDEQGYVKYAWDEPCIRETESRVGPNTLLATLRSASIDVDAMVFCGDGYSVNSIYHDSLQSCAESIAQALKDNVRYVAERALSPEEEASLKHRQAVQSVEYWHAEADASNNAAQQGSGLFKGCYTMLGQPLDQDAQHRILAYLNAPIQQGWLDVRSMAIAGHITLWQAWCAIDVSAPRSGDHGFPTADMVRRAIRQSVESRAREIAGKFLEVGPRGLRPIE